MLEVIETVLQVLWALLVIVAVLVLAYGCTRWMAGRAAGEGWSPASGGRITVLEKVPVGKDQKLLLVKLGEAYYFLGAASNGITCLGQVPAEEAQSWEAERREKKAGTPAMGFEQALRKVLRQRSGKEEG